MTKLQRAANEIRSASEQFAKITENWFTLIRDEGDNAALKQALVMFTLRPLINVQHDIVEFLASRKILAVKASDSEEVTGVTRTASLEHYMEVLRFVEGSLLNPYFYDSRDEYRDPAEKTLVVVAETLLYLIGNIRNPKN